MPLARRPLRLPRKDHKMAHRLDRVEPGVPR